MKLFRYSNPDIQIVKEPDHKHQWEVDLKTYATPRKDIKADIANNVTYEKALFGVTTVLWRCLVCPEFKKEELLGSDESTLDELITKADEYGPQYITAGEKTFIIAKYIPPIQQPGNYPVR